VVMVEIQSNGEEVIDKVREEAEKLKKENDELSRRLKQEKELRAFEIYGGDSEAGELPKPPKKLTPKEYAEAVERHEVNPLKDDGFGV